MTKPIFSILIDTYNHERYIEQAILSVLEQDFPASEMEIVVVDDGSTDRTPEIVRKFAPRVRLLQKKNGGQASAFNAGIAECGGSAIAFLDGDDWFAQGKLSSVAAALEVHPEAAAIGHGYCEVRDDGSTQTFTPPCETLYTLTSPSSVSSSEVWRFVLMGALTMRTSALRPVLPVPERLRFCADSPISFAALAGNVYLLKQPLFYYRHHSNNLYAKKQENDSERLKARYKMSEEAFRVSVSMLIRMGVPEERVKELLYAALSDASRHILSSFGGSRLETFRTEMRSFELDYKNPSLGYTLYKRVVVGGLTLLLPPRAFYRLLRWYGRRNLGSVRERIFKSGNDPIIPAAPDEARPNL